MRNMDGCMCNLSVKIGLPQSFRNRDCCKYLGNLINCSSHDTTAHCMHHDLIASSAGGGMRPKHFDYSTADT